MLRLRLSTKVWLILEISRYFTGTGPCLTTATWRCHNNFSRWGCSFLWKLRSHWLKDMRQRQIAEIRQGPGVTVLPSQCQSNSSDSYGYGWPPLIKTKCIELVNRMHKAVKYRYSVRNKCWVLLVFHGQGTTPGWLSNKMALWDNHNNANYCKPCAYLYRPSKQG